MFRSLPKIIDDLAEDKSNRSLIFEEQTGKRKARRLYQFVVREFPKRESVNIIAPTLADAVNLFNSTKGARGDPKEPIAVYLLDEVIE